MVRFIAIYTTEMPGVFGNQLLSGSWPDDGVAAMKHAKYMLGGNVFALRVYKGA